MTDNIIIQYALAILFLPLLAFVIQIFVGKRLPRQGDWVSIGAVLLTLVLSITLFVMMIWTYDPDFKEEMSAVWFDLGVFKVELGFLIDNITIIMLLVVALISTMSHIYSIKYMEGDIRYSRYYAYLSFFTFSMNGIVLANNLLSLYIFWELVGLSSYLLIAHWFEKESAAAAGTKAFLTNRVGDIGFFIGILILFTATGSFLYRDIFTGVAQGSIAGGLLTWAGIGLFMGAMGKSSQFPLHIWLPDAMEGPTPVSALMHAATMVAAGVYMVVRLFPLFSPEARLVIAYVGGFTALFAATIAITQNDIKKVLAYSTVSQLGYMLLAVGTGAYVAGFFHLVTHAMFKAGLFYGAGSVIHAMHHALHKRHAETTDPQDMRNMGGFKPKMPITYWTMIISALAISGIPFFSGFLSKDAILAGSLAFASYQPQHFLLPVFGFGAAIITAFYMFRLLYLTFHNKPALEDVYEEIHESPEAMTTPLITLSIFCLFVFYTLPYFNPFSDNGWFKDLVVAKDSLVVGNLTALEVEKGVHHAHLPTIVLSVLLATLGIFLSWLMYLKKKLSAERWAQRLPLLYRLSYHKYYFDENYNRFIYQPFLRLADRIGFLDWDLYDKYFINGFGRVTKWFSFLSGRLDYDGLDQVLVDGVGRNASRMGSVLKTIQTGHLQNYLLFALLGVVIIILIQAF